MRKGFFAIIGMFFAGLIFCIDAFAGGQFSHRATPSELAAARKHNKSFLQDFRAQSALQTSWQPVVDTADFGYVLMNAEEAASEEVADLRRIIAENLPANVKLVILASEEEGESIRSRYLRWIAADQLIVATDTSPYTHNGFWARDSYPIPVIDTTLGKTHLVSAQYFRRFESADAIASSVNGSVNKVDAVFVGGNLLADANGRCFSVDSDRLFEMNAEDLQSIYGCKEVHLMPYVSGIGDIDEVMKPLPNGKVLVTAQEYRDDLEAMGYSVVQLPRIRNSYRTYSNSLIVGNKVFMPAFGVSTDAEAQQVYESLGYEVIQIRSNYLSDSLLGSVHCQTMAYPQMDKEMLFKALGIREL